ncbi:MAG: pitrilysin family protein, partial [Myxococcota bacterium]
MSRSAPATHALSFEGIFAFSGDAHVHAYRLANGLRVLLLPDGSAPVASLQTWMSVGSRDEEPGRTGLAHFFEHLMFVGTERFPPGEFDRELEAIGAEFNAATWTDWTQYYATFRSKELERVVELEADRFENLALGETQIASEREVVISERRDRVDDDVNGKASELLFQLAFRKHGYGHPTIGWMEDIERYDRESCRRFATHNYRPSRASLIFAGEFDTQSTLELVQAHYGGLAAVQLPVRNQLGEPAQSRERRLHTTLPAETEKLLIGYRAPAIAERDWRVLAVAGDLLLGGRSGSLYRQLVLDDELATSAYGSLTPFEHPGLYEIGVSMRPDQAAESALTRIDEAMRRLADEGPSEAALERAKARSELSLLSSASSVSGKAEQVGFDVTVLGAPLSIDARIEAYRSVTRSDVRQVARKYFQTSQRSVVIVRPQREQPRIATTDPSEVDNPSSPEKTEYTEETPADMGVYVEGFGSRFLVIPITEVAQVSGGESAKPGSLVAAHRTSERLYNSFVWLNEGGPTLVGNADGELVGIEARGSGRTDPKWTIAWGGTHADWPTGYTLQVVVPDGRVVYQLAPTKSPEADVLIFVRGWRPA